MPRNIANRTTRPQATDPDGRTRVLETVSTEYSSGEWIAPHAHVRAQLVYAVAGIMTVRTAEGTWVVPPHRAVWVPARVEHQIQAAGRLSMRSLYIDPDAAGSLPVHCCVVQVTPLLRELILRAAATPRRDDADERVDAQEERIAALILDEIRASSLAPLHLPEPSDPRLKRIAAAVREDPAEGRSLAAWSRVVGASSRTLTRLFQAETGMSFRHWRRQARLLAALARLANGDSVTVVALDLGYGSPSAFIAMFRRALGTTPAQYFRSASPGRTAARPTGVG